MHFAHTPQITVLDVQKGKTRTTIVLSVDSERFGEVSNFTEPFLTMRSVPVGGRLVDLIMNLELCE